MVAIVGVVGTVSLADKSNRDTRPLRNFLFDEITLSVENSETMDF